MPPAEEVHQAGHNPLAPDATPLLQLGLGQEQLCGLIEGNPGLGVADEALLDDILQVLRQATLDLNQGYLADADAPAFLKPFLHHPLADVKPFSIPAEALGEPVGVRLACRPPPNVLSGGHFTGLSPDSNTPGGAVLS